MQIHELNNFTGTLGAGSYVAIDDGNDTGKVSTQQILANTEARIDNIIAGEAPSAAEVTDARYGADGVTYTSLGTAIRTQFTDVKSALYNNCTPYNLIGGKGNVYYPVYLKAGDKIILSTKSGESYPSGESLTIYICNSNKSNIDNYGFYNNRVITVPQDVYYIKLNKDAAVPIMINKGQTVLPYQDYYFNVKQLKEYIDKNLDNTVYSDDVSNITAMLGTMHVLGDTSRNRRLYNLFLSNNGVDFYKVSAPLPNIDNQNAAPFIFIYGDTLIVGDHPTRDYDESNTNRGCIQFFTTKDFSTWVESIVFFPTDTWDKDNYAINLFVDTQNNLYGAWSYNYRTEGTQKYYKCAYMSLTLNDDGSITSDRVLHDLGLPITDSEDNYTSYIDPYVLHCNVIRGANDSTRESEWHIVVKNELTTKIEWFVGTTLGNSLSSPERTFIGTGVEAPTLMYDERTNYFTLYATGYLLGASAIDLLLYSSFNYIDRQSVMMWSLAEYYSNEGMRHPALCRLTKRFAEVLSKYPTIYGNPYPTDRKVECSVVNGKLVMNNDPEKDLSLVAHERIDYVINATSDVVATSPIKMIPIDGQSVNIVFNQNANVEVALPLDTYCFDRLGGKTLKYRQSIYGKAKFVFEPFRNNPFTPIWIPSTASDLNNYIDD